MHSYVSITRKNTFDTNTTEVNTYVAATHDIDI